MVAALGPRSAGLKEIALTEAGAADRGRDGPGQAVELHLDAVNKRFGAVVAAADCSLQIRRGEIVALLGPSGCGKSTLLNIIAGFESPDSGEVVLRERTITRVPANRRGTAMVFQRYALFPHLTVAANIAYGLRAQRVDKKQANERVNEMISLLKLDGLERRYPAQLSGGQSQRVAVARALAIRPAVMLLDEAFSALDKNLREETQLELSLLLRRLQITTILVTHDQREAFTLADRIAVMERGRIVQVGTAEEVYHAPASPFVMSFLGTTNAIPATVGAAGEGWSELYAAGGLRFRVADRAAYTVGSAVTVFVRAEHLAVSAQPTPVHAAGPGRIELVTFLGATQRTVVESGAVQLLCDRMGGASSGTHLKQGDAAFLDFDPSLCVVVAR